MTKRIALCQLNPIAGRPEENFETIEKTIKNSMGNGVLLFIFPEDFLFGILRDRNDIKNAGDNFKYWVNQFCLLTKKYKVDIVPGSFPMIKNGKLFNTTVYINKKGQVLNQYSKTNLWLSEREEYSVSNKPLKCFDSVLGKTMQIICWDLMDRKLFEEAIKQNAEWIINVSLWSVNQSRDLARKRGKTKNKYRLSVRKSERLNSIIETRSAEYNIGIIFCNIGGTHEYIAQDGFVQEARSAGSTQILAPLDGVRKIAKNRKEQILICDVPEIKNYISDHEIFYGRREDIIKNYPYSQQGSL